jgi:hypothetical protein
VYEKLNFNDEGLRVMLRRSIQAGVDEDPESVCVTSIPIIACSSNVFPAHRLFWVISLMQAGSWVRPMAAVSSTFVFEALTTVSCHL